MAAKSLLRGKLEPELRVRIFAEEAPGSSFKPADLLGEL